MSHPEPTEIEKLWTNDRLRQESLERSEAVSEPSYQEEDCELSSSSED